MKKTLLFVVCVKSDRVPRVDVYGSKATTDTQEWCPWPRATTRLSQKLHTVTKSSSPPTTTYLQSGDQQTQRKPPK